MSRIENIGAIARKNMESRNVYTPEHVYEINSTAVEKIVNSIANTFLQGTSFDITNTVLGRVLGPNTPITTIGLHALGKQMLYNIKSNVATEIASTIDIPTLIKGKPGFLTRKEWHITVNQNGDSFLGQAIHAIKSATGIQESKDPFIGNNDENFHINHTGKSQVQSMVKQLQKNIGARKYDTKNKDLQGLSSAQKDNIVNYTNFPSRFGDVIIDPNGGVDPEKANRAMVSSKQFEIDNIVDETLRVKKLDELGFGKSEIKIGDKIENIVWGDGTTNGEFSDKFKVKRGILWYTKQLLDSRKDIDHHPMNQTIKNYGLDENGNKIYKGSTECTSYTQAEPYNQHVPGSNNPYPKLFRYRGNEQFIGKGQMSTINNSVMPTIFPTTKLDKRRLMFSFENLAWSREDIMRLPKCEQGDFGGRLMWFAPYDLQITENINVELETHKFIGRSEPLYTHNSGERTASISFKLVIDHSIVPDRMKGKNKKEAEWFYGCDPESDNHNSIADRIIIAPNITQEQIKVEQAETKPKSEDVKPDFKPEKGIITVYFENDDPKIDNNYENVYNPTVKQYGLNKNFHQNLTNNEENIIDYIKRKVDESDNYEKPLYRIEFSGAASRLNGKDYNEKLGLKRATALYNRIVELMSTQDPKYDITKCFYEKPTINSNGSTYAGEKGNLFINKDLEEVKRDRYATVNILLNGGTPKPRKTNDNVAATPTEKAIIDENKTKNDAVTDGINSNSDNDNIGCEDFTMETLAPTFKTGFDKSKYFVPAFHSYSAYDVHKRLTFLHQCTKQGTTLDVTSVKSSDDVIPKNSIFGRMPVCMMRIGDFLHTKVLIESMSFDYNETTWDMNPEGHGMQPMLVNVSMQIKIMGGQSLKAPIDALSNALSFNFYANSTYPNEKSNMYSNSFKKSAIDMENEQIGFINDQLTALKLPLLKT